MQEVKLFRFRDLSFCDFLCFSFGDATNFFRRNFGLLTFGAGFFRDFFAFSLDFFSLDFASLDSLFALFF